MSVSKLAEYLVASVSRRRGIIRAQKQPLDFVVARYGDVYDAIISSLRAGGSGDPIRERLKKLRDSSPRTAWQSQDAQLSLEALEIALDVLDDIEVGDFQVLAGAENPPEFKIAGVHVSVRPELILHSDKGVAGAMKLYISKTNPFTDESGAYAATILHEYLTDVLGHSSTDYRHCVVVDLFARRIHTAPRAFRKRRTDVSAACEEISQRWPAI